MLRGLVLAGGISARLGRDKAAVTLDGTPLLDRAVQLLASAVGDVRVGVRPGQASDGLRSRHRLVLDEGAAIGPAAGLLAAHRACPQGAWLVLACDMPNVSSDTVATLVRARDPAAAATAFRSGRDGRPEPLCAIYEPATLARFRRHVEEGGNSSPRDWLAAEGAVLLDPPGTETFDSLNTPSDLERMRRASRVVTPARKGLN